MKRADSNYIQRVLELCKYIKWTNTSDENYFKKEKNDEKVFRNSSRSCTKV